MNKQVNVKRISKGAKDVEGEERKQAEEEVLYFHAPRFPRGTASIKQFESKKEFSAIVTAELMHGSQIVPMLAIWPI